ncbi:MAG: lipoyl(octanoyl) transferase LipB [Myxococcota bacterium]|nr:lipoyl(octanoyl) transferase LipB [Myxococcota bacterium]
MSPPPTILRPGELVHDETTLCDYRDTLALMTTLTERPADAEDLLISVQHPPTITVGRRGGHELIHSRRLEVETGQSFDVAVYDVARGGSVTYHAPGQLVVYPVVQLARMAPPMGRRPFGDLPGFVRTLEEVIQKTCLTFGLETVVRPGFAGVWVDEQTKMASIGVGVRRGWTFHGLALNVCPHLEGFDLITPCGLEGVKMTSLFRELERRKRPTPGIEEVESELLGRLQRALLRAD